jgi:hypothetical protein
MFIGVIMFKCLKRLFNRKRKPKNVILVGHNRLKPGAKVIGYQNEYMYNSKVGHVVKNLLPELEVCFYNELEKDYVVLADPGFIAIELHCNAFNGYVEGAEVLCLADDRNSESYAEDFLFDLCDRFGKRNRGVKKLEEGDRGYKNLKNAKTKGARIAVIVEPFFGDNDRDVIHSAEYAQFLVDWFSN